MRLVRYATIALSGLLLTSFAVGHDLGAEVHLLGEQLEVRAFFDDGSVARHALVELLRATDRQRLAEARTDHHGRCRLPRPPAGSYLIRVNAGAGHIHEETITVPAAAAGAARPNDSLTATGSPTLRDNASDGNRSVAGSLDASSPTLVSEPPAIRISSGPGYEEKTRFPWLKLALGLAAIFGLATAAWWTLRFRQARCPSANHTRIPPPASG